MPRAKGMPSRVTGDSARALARRRRYQSHRCVLEELRRIERHMQPAIQRLPFQRAVREICEQWRVGMRWTASALLCLQELAEDYIIEFFNDAYILAAHAHRLTIMPRDFDSLRRLRFRYDQLLQPGPIRDDRTMRILTVPPLHPRARQEEGSGAAHSRSTRSQVETQPPSPTQDEPQPPTPTPVPTQDESHPPNPSLRVEAHPPSPSRIEVQPPVPQDLEDEMYIQEINNDNIFQLGQLADSAPLRGKILLPSRDEDACIFPLDRQDFLAMRDFLTSNATDGAINAVLWHTVSLLPEDVQNVVYILDPLISALLQDNNVSFFVLLNWFRVVNFEVARFIITAYNQSEHWSLLMYDIEQNTVYYANSGLRRGFHGRVKFAGRKLVCAIEHILLESDLAANSWHRRVTVPTQDDNYSCGWRTGLNALLLISQIMNVPNDLRLEDYGPYSVRKFSVLAIQAIILSVCRRSREEVERGEEFARTQRQREEQHEQDCHQYLQSIQAAINQYYIDNTEVTEWTESQRQLQQRMEQEQRRQEEEAVRRAWEEFDEASASERVDRQQRQAGTSGGRNRVAIGGGGGGKGVVATIGLAAAGGCESPSLYTF
ncbi:hypothetical protein L7F22_065416 [Adiantum nelumboides]|nr:hypothetical protein [Adiantum nelumboides]